MFEELLADLDSRGVRFVVVGGLAVVIHGVVRLTAAASLHHLIAMKRAAARPQDLLDIQQLEQMRRQHGV